MVFRRWDEREEEGGRRGDAVSRNPRTAPGRRATKGAAAAAAATPGDTHGTWPITCLTGHACRRAVAGGGVAGLWAHHVIGPVVFFGRGPPRPTTNDRRRIPCRRRRVVCSPATRGSQAGPGSQPRGRPAGRRGRGGASWGVVVAAAVAPWPRVACSATAAGAERAGPAQLLARLGRRRPRERCLGPVARRETLIPPPARPQCLIRHPDACPVAGGGEREGGARLAYYARELIARPAHVRRCRRRRRRRLRRRRRVAVASAPGCVCVRRRRRAPRRVVVVVVVVVVLALGAPSVGGAVAPLARAPHLASGIGLAPTTPPDKSHRSSDVESAAPGGPAVARRGRDGRRLLAPGFLRPTVVVWLRPGRFAAAQPDPASVQRVGSTKCLMSVRERPGRIGPWAGTDAEHAVPRPGAGGLGKASGLEFPGRRRAARRRLCLAA